MDQAAGDVRDQDVMAMGEQGSMYLLQYQYDRSVFNLFHSSLCEFGAARRKVMTSVSSSLYVRPASPGRRLPERHHHMRPITSSDRWQV